MNAIKPRLVSPRARCLLAFAVAGALLGPPLPARADVFTGPLFFTTFAGGMNVNKVTFTYNTSGGGSFSFGAITPIAATPGADGLVFTSDGFLAVGGQGNAVYRVNPTTGAFTSQNAGGTSAFHMMVAPDGTIYSSGIPGTPATYNSTLTNNGTAHPTTNLAGGPSFLDTISWSGSNSASGFYTSSGPGGGGSFGTINLTTFTTTVKIPVLPAAHGMAFDPFTNTLILFGDSHITQIDPNNPTVVLHDLVVPGVQFDQGTVDGLGHIYAASNFGTLTFLDISGSMRVDLPNFMTTLFLAGALDDIAPLAGPGSSNPVPEASKLLLSAIGIVGLIGYSWRRRKLLA